MKKRNRGKAPNDDELFNQKWQAVFYEALKDMTYLLSREYGSKSSLQIVGGKYRLNARQQKALMGMSASEESVISRKSKEVTASELQGKEVHIDGFNLLIILESAISAAYLFKGKDGAYRDVTSVHGGYKRVMQTDKAIEMVAQMLKDLGVSKTTWYLDAPVSNSGRLKTHLREFAEAHDYNWEIILAYNPDKELIASEEIIISSDAWILEDGKRWFNAMDYLLEHHLSFEHLILADKPKKIAIVTCVKDKKEEACPAKEMYQGDLFESFFQAAEDIQPDEILILSGKYHLLELDKIIQPYDLNLNHQSENYQTLWADKVLNQLKNRFNLKQDSFYFFTSENYCKHLTPYIRSYFRPIHID